ncbi:MAG: hypothetical protein M3508_09395 [Actinomycetota bacterium]|nr:hypothetical protein [Actinomycetota bacterium]
MPSVSLSPMGCSVRGVGGERVVFAYPPGWAFSRSTHRGSITRLSSVTVRAAGGPPSRTHLEIVAG